MQTTEATDHITIGGKDIPVKKVYIKQEDLNFYPENPRIYSILHADGGRDLSQDEIMRKLSRLEHVKKLCQSIKANGGLIDPLIVRDGDYLVLEGNSRLAAYRMLADNDPIKWGKVVCHVLPADIDDSLIFKLLGQYHIIGKTDWSPYEQAGYLYRRNKQCNVSTDEMSREMGMSKRSIENLINIYDFMQVHNDLNPQRWSYYVEYLKSRHIKKYRDTVVGFDNAVVKKIKTGEINAAIDIRNKLDPIARVKGQKGASIVNRLINGFSTFEEAFEEAENCGATNNIYQKLSAFRNKIANPETKKDIKNMDSNQVKKCKFELKKIKEAIELIMNDLD